MFTQSIRALHYHQHLWS